VTGKPDPAIACSVSGPLALGLTAMVFLLAGFGGWATVSRLSGAVIATGRVEVDRNQQVIQHPDGGVVQALLVDEGDRVPEGALLLRLSPEVLAPQLAIARVHLFETRARRTRLEAERDGQDHVDFPERLVAEAEASPDLSDVLRGQGNMFESRRATLTQEVEQLRGRIAQIEAQITALDAQDRALREQLALVAVDLDRQQGLLERGLAEAAPILRLQREAAQLRGSLGEVESRKAEAAERIAETNIVILHLHASRRESAIAELREVRLSEEDLRARVSDLSRRMAQLELRAPVAGTIHRLQVYGPQSVIRPAEPLAFLVPEGRPLVISARVAATDVDQVHTGQDVNLRLPAFDTRTTPDLLGQVSRVSADAFTDDAGGQAYYRIEIVLEDGQMDLLEDGALLPGMPVDAFIRTTDRAPITYLLEPLSVYFNRAFRES